MATNKRFREKRGHVDIALGTDGQSTGNDPDFKLLARSEMAIGDKVTFDVGLRGIDDLEQPDVDGFVALDARLGYRLSNRLELYVAGANLLDRVHDENGFSKGGQQVERTIHAGARVRF